MAFKQLPKILVSRVREESLSGAIFNTLKGLEDFEVSAFPYDMDITQPRTYPDLSTYDMIFNCSGMTLNESVLQHNYQNAKKVLDINIGGAMTLTSEFAKARIARNLGGVIIHIGSMGAKTIFTNCSAYCASKAALAHYVECAGYELKKHNIYILGVHPGNIIGTQMTNQVVGELINNRGMTPEQVETIYKDAHNVQDVADLCVNLLALPLWNMTGENIYLANGHKW